MEFPEFWTHELLCERLLRELLIDQKQQLENQKQILCNQEKIMAKIDELKAAVVTAQGKLAKLTTDLNEFISENSGGASDTDIQAVTDSLNQISTGLDTLDATINPPATT